MASPVIHEIVNQLRKAVEAYWGGDSISKRLPLQTDLFSPVDQEIESAVQLFDHISTTFRHALARLRAHRNQSCTINTLPVEVLAGIFGLAGERGRALDANLCIASTCSHWREISMNVPLLWSCIDLTSRVCPPRHYLKVLLERSRQTPLEFYGTLQHNTWLFDLVSSQAARLKVLRDIVFERPRDDHPGFSESSSPPPPSTFTFSAPLLEDFGVVFGGWADTIDLHLPLLDAVPEKLTILSLRNGRFPWNSQNYRNLVSLSIVNIPLFYDSLDEGDILAVCRSALQLESLELKLPSDWRAPLPGYVQSSGMPTDMGLHAECIEMRSLRSLVLETRVEVLLHILWHISLPTHIHELRLALESNQRSFVDALLSPNALPTFIFGNLRSMKIEHRQYRPHVMEIEADGRGEGGEYHFSLQATYWGGNEEDHQLTSIAGPHLLCPTRYELPALKVLEFSEEEPRAVEASSPHIARMLVSLSSLSSLILRGRGFTSSFGHLSHAIEGLITPPSPCNGLPMVQEIAVYNRSSDRCRHYNSSGLPHIEDMDGLISFLRPFSYHLLELRLHMHEFDSRDGDGVRHKVREFIKNVRDLGISDVWWPHHALWCAGTTTDVRKVWSDIEGLSLPHFLPCPST